MACIAMFVPVILTFPEMAQMNAVVMHEPEETTSRSEDLPIPEVADTVGL